jgi:hypothetical protein
LRVVALVVLIEVLLRGGRVGAVSSWRSHDHSCVMGTTVWPRRFGVIGVAYLSSRARIPT